MGSFLKATKLTAGMGAFLSESYGYLGLGRVV